MSLNGARAFVSEVNGKGGRYPGLYSGSLIKQQLGNNSDPILAQCFFWLANTGRTPSSRQTGRRGPAGSTQMAMSDRSRTLCLAIGACDRDKFNGDLDDLRKLWGSVPPLLSSN